MNNLTSPLSAVSAGYMHELEARYKADPRSVEPGWRCVLDVIQELELDAGTSSAAVQAVIENEYRLRGHLAADIDPLGLSVPPTMLQIVPSLKAWLIDGANARLVERMQAAYCGTLAVESGHIDDMALRQWICSAVEGGSRASGAETACDLLAHLVAAEEFERFMGVKFPGKKRFGAEGAECLIPLLDRLLRNAVSAAVTDVIIGTMHRGRLNASANVFGKPLERLFAEFKGAHPSGECSAAAGDVPYHLGYEAELVIENRKLRVTLAPNPSHLEAVNTVVLGRVRARQNAGGGPHRVLGVIIHTDASVIGQGLVAEMLQLGGLAGFSTGGTLHVIINNQIGFTTEPKEARTSRHCSAPWKAIDSLIVHANGDDPEAAVRAADLAFDFRQAHARDAVIDLVCYRRNGHNEVDEPRFTQPLLYDAIERHPSVATLFGKRLLQHGSISAAQVESLTKIARARLEQAFDRAEKAVAMPASRLDDSDAQASPRDDGDAPAGGLTLEKMTALLAAVASVPEGVAVNQKVSRIVRQRAQTAGSGIQWAVGESLAFASLVTEGVAVRLSGQDAVRGVFSQRHLALIDTQTGRRHLGLDAMAGTSARFEAINSPLSEYAVLGFEYGYSVEQGDALVIWEAQFGDFANGAQIIIDQFLASGEEKWRQSSGLVMLLPHGLEGQGPEHSSARLERFLQLCARNNLQVAQPSTPANYFHLLRRQAYRRPRKPLVIMTPKSLLRHPAAVSSLSQFASGTRFQPVIAAVPGDSTVRHVMLCSGKIAYDLAQERAARNVEGVAIVRLEQLYPFPAEQLAGLFEQWPDAQLTWVQEEPRNLGAWNFIDRRLEAVIERAGAPGRTGAARNRVACVSRPESASPAGSFHGNHERDQRRILDEAFVRATNPLDSPCLS